MVYMLKNSTINKEPINQNNVNRYTSAPQEQALEKIEDINNRYAKALKKLAQNKKELWSYARNNNKYNHTDQCLITTKDEDFNDDDWCDN